MNNVDWQLLENRLQSIERSIEMLKAMFPVRELPTPFDGMQRFQKYGELGKIPCVLDKMSKEDRMKPLCISCPCPKCSPYALSYGSLIDAGLKQEWADATIRQFGVDCISTTKIGEE